MFQVGAVLSRSPAEALSALAACSQQVAQTLYVAIGSDTAGQAHTQPSASCFEQCRLVRDIYMLASRVCPQVDVRLLLSDPRVREAIAAEQSELLHPRLCFAHPDIIFGHLSGSLWRDLSLRISPHHQPPKCVPLDTVTLPVCI